MAPLVSFLAQQLHGERERPRWVVAFSGGLDSTVLLHALCQLPGRPPVHALHIHHALHSQADTWQTRCETFCQSLEVPFFPCRVLVDDSASLEDAARRARYAAYEAFLNDGDLLLQAHHLDDQVETLFLRLLRGSGPKGLRGMPAKRPLAGGAMLLRPFLTLPRSELEAYSSAVGLDWIEDPSNADTGFDRNYLRHNVLPLLAQRWPGYRKSVGRLAGLMQKLPLSAMDWAAQTEDPVGPVIDVAELRALGEAQRNTRLRRWLGSYELVPSQAQLSALQQSMLWSSGDAEPVVELGGRQVRRYRGRLYLTSLERFDGAVGYFWDARQPLYLPGAGRLSARRSDGGSDYQFEIRFRRGGERCRPMGRAHSQSLKKLLQETGIPPWRRRRLPLIYLNGELAAVADLWICEDFAEVLSGWRFHWQPLD